MPLYGHIATPARGVACELRIYDHLTPATNVTLQFLHNEHAQRKHRMYCAITSGRILHAKAIFDTNSRADIQQFIDAGHISSYAGTKAYYSDGAYRDKGTHAGISSSAVVWTETDEQGDLVWASKTETHERDIGGSDDAELYAIKLALEQAKDHLSDPEYLDIDNIVMFTDCQNIVMMVAGEPDSVKVLGPIPLKGDWALQHIYDDVATLHRWGKNVVVAWIKDHKKQNEGNRHADKAAASVIYDVLDGGEPIPPFPLEKRNWDARKEEYLYRRSMPWFRDGEGGCWVHPELSGHAEEVVKGEKNEKDTFWQDWRDVYHGRYRRPLLPRPVDYGAMYAEGRRMFEKAHAGEWWLVESVE